MNYSGIDPHSNSSVVSVINETDRVVAEKRLPNGMGLISSDGTFASMRLRERKTKDLAARNGYQATTIIDRRDPKI
jgi:hypothetical protein